MTIAFFLFLLSSCEKDFVVKDQASLKGMVINSLFSDGWPISVYLTESYSSTGNNNVHSLANARMELYEDGVFKELLTYVPSDTVNNSGQYLSQLVPQAGKKYLLKAIHPEYGVAIALDSVPVPVHLVSQQLLQYPDTLNRDSDALISFRFLDDGSTENYYRINSWIDGTATTINPNGDTVQTHYSQGLRPELLTTVADTVRDNGWFLLFSDKNFNGLQQELKLKFTHQPFADGFTNLTLYIDFYTVTKAHFEYHRTLELYRHSQNNNEPVHVYSNVQGGYGIFAGSDFQRLQYVIK